MDYSQFLDKMEQVSRLFAFFAPDTKLYPVDNWTVCVNHVDPQLAWNYAFPHTVEPTLETLTTVENFFGLHARQPCVYLVDSAETEPFSQQLQHLGYIQAFHDQWLFWNPTSSLERQPHRVEQVQSEQQLEDFLYVYRHSFVEGDPQNAWGSANSESDIENTRQNWYQFAPSGQKMYFTAYDQEQPVATCAISFFEGLGYLSNVGSLPQARGRGFAKAVVLQAVEEYYKLFDTEVFLLTEVGKYPDQFYQRIGFEARVSARALAKNVP